MSTDRAPGPLTRLARRHGLMRSPLPRITDRIEATATATLAVLSMLILALATTIAMGNYQRELTQAATTATQRTAMTAVLLTNSQLRHPASSEHRVPLGTTALASRQLPNGQQSSAPCGWTPTATPGTGYQSG
jgi:hypothetical protein